MEGEVAGEAAGARAERELERVVRGRGGDPEPRDGEGVSREVEVVVGEGAVNDSCENVVADIVDDGACNALPGGEGGGPDLLGLGQGGGGAGEQGERGGEESHPPRPPGRAAAGGGFGERPVGRVGVGRPVPA